jgi:hypothetical protein
MEKSTKLAINLTEGTVHVEGDEAFVRSVYEDFKSYLTKQGGPHRPVIEPGVPLVPEAPRIATETPTRNRRADRKLNGSKGDKPRVTEYKPKFRPDLDLSGLEAVYDEFTPTKHTEKILFFAVFLRDRLHTTPCTADDIYTCYFTMKEKTETPEAFIQAFRDTQNKTHFIEFTSPEVIKVTIAGDNYYNKRLQQKKESAK